jgi:hypothetical protein
VARHTARRRLLRQHRASGCLGTSLGSSHGSSRHSSSTTLTTPRVQVPRHVAGLVTRLVAPLVVDCFAYAARPGASARRAACHLVRRRLLHLRRASVCFGTSCGLSRDSSLTTSHRAGSSSTTSPTPRVRVPRHVAWLVAPLVAGYFDYVARLGASSRRVARRAAHRRLLRLRRASGCIGTSRGSSLGSLSTSSPTPHIRLLRHVTRLVA